MRRLEIHSIQNIKHKQVPNLKIKNVKFENKVKIPLNATHFRKESSKMLIINPEYKKKSDELEVRLNERVQKMKEISLKAHQR
jgi:hypothetical protein